MPTAQEFHAPCPTGSGVITVANETQPIETRDSPNLPDNPKGQSKCDDIERGIAQTGNGKEQVDNPATSKPWAENSGSAFKALGWLDRLLALWIFLAMAFGIILGNFVPNIGPALQKGKFNNVSVPIGECSRIGALKGQI